MDQTVILGSGFGLIRDSFLSRSSVTHSVQVAEALRCFQRHPRTGWVRKGVCEPAFEGIYGFPNLVDEISILVGLGRRKNAPKQVFQNSRDDFTILRLIQRHRAERKFIGMPKIKPCEWVPLGVFQCLGNPRDVLDHFETNS